MKWLLVLIQIVSQTVGEVCRAVGMRQHGEIHDFRPGALGRVVGVVARNGTIIASFCAMAVAFFSFMKLVAIAPMSFAVPVSAASLIPETILARLVLRETVDWRRWTGVSLIAAGVLLIS
jgi:drug/metabolite transporter (DMT)-like permease